MIDMQDGYRREHCVTIKWVWVFHYQEAVRQNQPRRVGAAFSHRILQTDLHYPAYLATSWCDVTDFDFPAGNGSREIGNEKDEIGTKTMSVGQGGGWASGPAATPVYYLRSVDTRKPQDSNDFPISG